MSDNVMRMKILKTSSTFQAVKWPVNLIPLANVTPCCGKTFYGADVQLLVMGTFGVF